MHLQRFDDYGAAAALWGPSDTGFTVSGVFRDMADFAVLVLFQKDDPFGHSLFSYLPDGDLTGLILDFDVTWQGIQAWESLKSTWTDWNTLDYPINGIGHTDVEWIGTTGISWELASWQPCGVYRHWPLFPQQFSIESLLAARDLPASGVRPA
jgi:hypothetical protein